MAALKGNPANPGSAFNQAGCALSGWVKILSQLIGT